MNRPARGGAGRSAAAVEAYQRAAKAGDEAIQAAREIRVRAGRRLGKEIKAARKKGELAKQGRPRKDGNPASLSDLGLEGHEAAEAVALAGEGEDPDEPAPEELFEAALEEAKRTGETSEGAVVALMAVGARAAEALPPDASPATVIRAVKRAMEDAAGVRRDPSPKEADRLAREKGEWVWGSDGRWHTGSPRPTREEMAEHDRLVAVRLAAYALADRGKRLEPPGRFLALIQDWAREEWVGGCSTRPSATCGGCAPPSATRKGPPHR